MESPNSTRCGTLGDLSSILGRSLQKEMLKLQSLSNGLAILKSNLFVDSAFACYEALRSHEWLSVSAGKG